MKRILPAMGYSEQQRESLAETINACCAAENVTCIVDASPARLDRMLDLDVPLARVIYRFRQIDGPPLEELVKRLL
jgi:predicted GTPase